MNLEELTKHLQERFRARIGMGQVKQERMIDRQAGLQVINGICPHCKGELARIGKVDKVVNYRCSPCALDFKVVDPMDEINRLMGSK